MGFNPKPKPKKGISYAAPAKKAGFGNKKSAANKKARTTAGGAPKGRPTGRSGKSGYPKGWGN